MTALEVLRLECPRIGYALFDSPATPIRLPKLNELGLSARILTTRTFDFLLSGNPQVSKIDIADTSFTADTIQLLAQYVPRVSTVALTRCSITTAPIEAIGWGNLSCLNTLSLTDNNRYTNLDGKILKSLVVGNSPLESLKLSIFDEEFETLEYVSQLRYIDKLKFLGPSYSLNYTVDQMKHLFQSLTNLMEVNLESRMMDVHVIKAILRVLVQRPMVIYYYASTSSYVLKEDCEQIDGILAAHLDLDLMIEACGGVDVSCSRCK